MTTRQLAAFEVLSSRVTEMGEPFRAAFDPETLRAKVKALGFGSVHDMGSEELNAAYFSGRSDGLQVGGAGRILTAHA